MTSFWASIRCEGSIPEQIIHAAVLIEEWVPNAGRWHGADDSGPSACPLGYVARSLVGAVLPLIMMAGDRSIRDISESNPDQRIPAVPGLADPAKPLTISRCAVTRIVRVCSDLGVARELSAKGSCA